MCKSEIRSLTGLRGVAAAFVVVFHLCNPVPASSGTLPVWRQFLWHGYLSVDMFFVLSGFVMALSYGQNFALQPWLAAYGHFLQRRIARIYPLYAAVTVIVFLLHAGVPGQVSLPHPVAALTANLAMVQNWGIGGGIVVPAWSISTEWAAYLLFPLLAAALLSGEHWLSLGTLAISAATLCALAYPSLHLLPAAADAIGPLDLHDGRSFASLLRCVADFSLGMFAFRIYRTCPAAGRQALVAFCPVAVALSAFLLTQAGSDVLVVLLAVFVILGIADDQGVVARVLASPALHRLGLYSYALYLVHASFLRVGVAAGRVLARAGTPLAGLAGDAVTIVGSLAAAALAYHLIERPGQAWLNGTAVQRIGRVPGPAGTTS